jgi:hypothetical protein
MKIHFNSLTFNRFSNCFCSSYHLLIARDMLTQTPCYIALCSKKKASLISRTNAENNTIRVERVFGFPYFDKVEIKLYFIYEHTFINGQNFRTLVVDDSI